jgi:hypothetical protein
MEESRRKLGRQKCRWKNNTNITIKSRTERCELQSCGAEGEKGEMNSKHLVGKN